MKNAILLTTFLAVGAGSCGSEDKPRNPCDLAAADTHALLAQVNGCIGANVDVHLYKVTVPTDRPSGYLQVSGAGEGGGRLQLIVYQGPGMVELGRFRQGAAGGPVVFFLANASGHDHWVGVANEGTFSARYDYSVQTEYRSVPDVFEPNDTIQSASNLLLGVPIPAFLFAGRKGLENEPLAYDDYYRVGVAGGTLTIRIDDVPRDIAPRVTLHGSDGMEVSRISSGILGGALVLRSPPLPGPGHVFVRIAPWSGVPQNMGSGPTLPDHFTHPYTLSVTQP